MSDKCSLVKKCSSEKRHVCMFTGKIGEIRKLSIESRYKWWQLGKAVVFQLVLEANLMPKLKIQNRLKQNCEGGVG